MAIINSVRGDIKVGTGSISFKDAVSDGTNLYTICDDKTLRAFNLSTLQQTGIGNVSLGTNTVAGVCLISSATAVVAFTAAEVNFVNVTTGQRTVVTTGTVAVRTASLPQQVAGNTSNQTAIATTATAGTVKKILGTTQTVSSLTPSGLAGVTPACVINKLDTNTWLIGASASAGSGAKIVEIDASGSTLQSVITPFSPNTGAVPSYNIISLSYYNGVVAASSDVGNIYFYRWSDGTLLYTLVGLKNGTFGGQLTLSEAPGGFCIATPNQVMGGGSMVPIQIINMNTISQKPSIIETFWNECSTQGKLSGYDMTAQKAWFMSQSFSGVQLRFFNLNPCSTVTETTRSQDPVGTNVSSRIIRYRDPGVGRGSVELDQSVSAGSVSLNCVDGQNYIEISLRTGPPEKWDIREFTA